MFINAIILSLNAVVGVEDKILMEIVQKLVIFPFYT